jgi:hypothetical protein
MRYVVPTDTYFVIVGEDESDDAEGSQSAWCRDLGRFDRRLGGRRGTEEGRPAPRPAFLSSDGWKRHGEETSHQKDQAPNGAEENDRLGDNREAKDDHEATMRPSGRLMGPAWGRSARLGVILLDRPHAAA